MPLVDIPDPPYAPAKPARQGHAAMLVLVAKLTVICAIALVACEIFWRLVGQPPAPSDLMAFARLRTEALNTSNAVALLGSSRVEADLDPRVLQSELPDMRFFQLGINGQSPLPFLEDFAQDTEFHGTVLCEFGLAQLMAAYPFQDDLGYLRFVKRRPYLRFARTWMHQNVIHHLAFLDHNLWDWLAGTPTTVFRREDRFTVMHRAGLDNSGIIAHWQRLTFDNKLQSNGISLVPRVLSWVDRIRSRGGNVLFIRLPVSGSLKLLEERLYPEWRQNLSALREHGVTVIEFSSEPTLSSFQCPDESHLDADAAQRFSLELARILRDRNLLKPAAHSLFSQTKPAGAR